MATRKTVYNPNSFPGFSPTRPTEREREREREGGEREGGERKGGREGGRERERERGGGADFSACGKQNIP